MAVAEVEERSLLKTLRWYDGFVIALANPGFLLGSLGYSVLDLGGWGAVLLWGIMAFLAIFLNVIYSELAAMFPEKSGGIALYAHEGWRRYTTLVGPIATFGYWIAWSVVLAIFGILIGQFVTGAWFSGEPLGTPYDEGWFSMPDLPLFGAVAIGLPHIIATGLIVAVWLFNVLGVRVSVRFGYLAGILLMVPLFGLMVLPFLNGDFDSGQPHLGQAGRRGRVALGRLPARARLDVAHDLVGVGRGRLRHLRARVQGHGQRHEDGAALRGRLLAPRLHAPAARDGRRGR